MNIIKVVNRRFKQARKLVDPSFIFESKYTKYYNTLEVIPKTIVLDAQHGESVNGNLYYLLKEIITNPRYKDYTVYFNVAGNKMKQIKKTLEAKGFLDKITLVKNYSRTYFRLLASANYLFTDTSYPSCFIKKDGQVVFNTWHGTPLKTLGRSDKAEYFRLGNIQKNFIMSDYLLYPNEYMMEHMIEDYMFANISESKMLLEGYPRNEIFFDEDERNRVRKELELEGKKIFAYMPTWRGLINGVEDDGKELTGYFKELDENLKDDQVLYVNLHPFVSSNIKYNDFKHIKKFPVGYETYEFLNIVDCLITDYSSVFFDYANTKNKVILFTYDEEKYLEERGTYFPLDELPFPRVKTVKDLLIEINSEKSYDDKAFLDKFCKYDNKYASKRLCQKVILNEDSGVIELDLPKNGKKNVLIYPGALSKNGVTTSILNLLNQVDTNRANYYVSSPTRRMSRNRDVLLHFPDSIAYVPVFGKMNLSFAHKMVLKAYKHKFISIDTLLKYVKKDYINEIKRAYGNAKFDVVIQFSGYDYKKMILYSLFEDATKIMYVHTDTYKEITKKKTQRLDTIQYAYTHFDKLALVSEDLIEPVSKIMDVKDKIRICPNLFDYKRVQKLSKKEIKFDEDKTEANITVEDLKEKLADEKLTKFIGIGRYSFEKGNDRLLDAFEKFHEEHNDTYLVIIGGYGPEYEKLQSKLKWMKCKDSVAMIKYMTNPYAVLAKCDSLILPSRYEGFGLVLIEADTLGKPVVSTNIVGPSTFMNKHGGVLVDNSVEGVEEGLKLLYNKEVKTLDVDYEEYNKEALEKFYKLMD